MQTKKALTKDVKFLVALFELTGESEGATFDRYEIGEKVGLTQKAVKAVTTLLLQANFIKKSEGDKVYLTQNGRTLVTEL